MLSSSISELFNMEFASILIGIGVCAGITFFVYLISAFGTKEKSFEEAIEEQKKRSQEEELQMKQERVKKDKEKKFKKWGRRTKEKSDQPSEIKESEKVECITYNDSRPGVEIIGDIEIVEPREIKIKKKGKSVASKATNKPESSLSSEEADTLEQVQKPVSESVNTSVVQQEKKDKAEKLLTKDKEKSKVDLKESETSQPKANESERNLPTGNALVQAIPATTVSTPSKKKKRAEQLDKEPANLTATKLISFVKGAELGDEESQMLIDILLNKQKEAAGWTKKNDPLTAVKKQLQEKEQILELEQRQSQATAAKLKELRQEYTQEKSKASAQERLLQDKINHQQQEIQALTARMKQSHEQHLAESAALQEKMDQLEISAKEKDDKTFKALQEENAKLQETLSKLQSEIQTGSEVSNLELELNQLQSAKEEYEGKLASLQKLHDDLQERNNQLEEQSVQQITSHKKEVEDIHCELSRIKKQLEEANDACTALSQETELLKSQIKNFEIANAALEQQQLKATEDVKNSKSDLEYMEAKLEESQNCCKDLETQAAHLASRVSELTHQNSIQLTKLDSLQQDNEKLSAQLAFSNERIAGDGQEILHQNGELHGKAEENIQQKSATDHEQILQEKETALKQLSEDLNKQKAEISILTLELENQKQKNNELRERNWKAMEAISITEKSAEEKVQEIRKTTDITINKMQKELEEKAKLAEESSLSVKRAQELEQKLQEAESKATELEQKAEERIRLCHLEAEQKNNSLRSEFISAEKLRKSAESKISEIEVIVKDLNFQIQKTQVQTKECLLRLFPNITIDHALQYDNWLLLFEEQAFVAISDSKNAEELLVRLSDVEHEKKNLEDQIKHYQSVLSDTETTLNRLQSSVESEEQIWREKLNSTEQELKNASAERDNLAAEKATLEATLQQMQGLDEMQEKLKQLQEKIESEENERMHLEQKYDEVNKNCINLQDQLDSKNKEIQDLQEEATLVENYRKELEDLKGKLEKERKITKDLSAQSVKLNSLVKIGQDALKAEEENVKRLTNQLQAFKGATANGTSNQSPAITQNSESQVPLISSEKPKKSKKTDASGRK